MPGAPYKRRGASPFVASAPAAVAPGFLLQQRRLAVFEANPEESRIVRRSSLTPVIPQPLGVSGQWNNVLSDDFDGPASAAPNAALWNYWDVDTDRGALLGGASCMLRSWNTYLDGAGSVVLRRTILDVGHGAESSCGGLESKQQFGPGSIFEWRMLHATNSGHSTGWTQTKNGMNGGGAQPNRADGYEVDATENWGNNPSSAIHYGGYSGGSATSLVSYGVSAASWHVYSVQWLLSDGGYVFRLDGVVQSGMTITALGSATNTDQVMRATIEPDQGGNECLAYVDYMRAWVP